MTTKDSARNHGYVRKTLDGKDPFSVFWADGNPDKIGPSHLYFGSADAIRVWELPYDMAGDSAKPVETSGR